MKGSGKPSAMMAHLALQCIQVPTLVRQKFLQIIASSNDEVNEQSKTKKNNSSKRVLGLEIASAESNKTEKRVHGRPKSMKGSGKPSAMMAHLALQCIQVPTLVRQKFLQIIASSNDEVNEQSKTKKNNSSKRVLGLEIASDCKTLSTRLIDKEVARISISIEKELKSEENLSLVVDSWKICSDIVKKISFGKNVLSQCQKFVSYFQGTYKAGAQLCNEIVDAFIMGGGLKSSVVTRWSSAWDCCNSVLRLENIFRNMIEKDPRCMSTNLYNLVNDRNFWANVECLTNVLSPAKKAVKCIESTNSTLADIFLILIQMAATIKQLPISDSTECKGFQRQCIQIYNKRWIQFNDC
ncbi:13219_t:CDS:2 [Entrophospora sp. SA101]|nr:13219_t:CDS:2 [Entrophospora sp. SA101]